MRDTHWTLQVCSYNNGKGQKLPNQTFGKIYVDFRPTLVIKLINQNQVSTVRPVFDQYSEVRKACVCLPVSIFDRLLWFFSKIDPNSSNNPRALIRLPPTK